MITQEIIKRLRNLGPLGRIMDEIVIVAADRLEELQRLNDSMQTDRDLWIKVGRKKLEAVEKKLTDSTNHYNGIIIELARERDEARAEVEQAKTTRPEPSPLEIAAMLKAGWFANPDALTRRDDDPKWWIERADELIAAAKETK
jgi:hypothetical protein